MAGIKGNCFSCKKEIEFSDRVGRKEECIHCSADIHVCMNCSHYDQTAYNECRETSADRIVDKDKSNFCDFFVLGGSANKDDSKDLKAAAEALFKKN